MVNRFIFLLILFVLIVLNQMAYGNAVDLDTSKVMSLDEQCTFRAEITHFIQVYQNEMSIIACNILECAEQIEGSGEQFIPSDHGIIVYQTKDGYLKQRQEYTIFDDNLLKVWNILKSNVEYIHVSVETQEVSFRHLVLLQGKDDIIYYADMELACCKNKRDTSWDSALICDAEDGLSWYLTFLERI